MKQYRAERRDNKEKVYGFLSTFPKTKFPTTITSEKYIDNSGVPIVKTYEVDQNTICEFVKKDKNNKYIYTTDKFRFEVDCEDKVESLIGSFEFNEEELRYEINIYDRNDYICLWYDCLKMRFFELIPNET